MTNSRAIVAAQKLSWECGLRDPLQLPIKTIVQSLGIVYKEEEIDGADGRILIKKNSAVITVNSRIELQSKKRFVIAHELGHFILHRDNLRVYNDTEETLNQWYQENYTSAEQEANEFAAEFLMPSELFYKECKDKIFDPEVIDDLAERFQVSKTATILRFVKEGNYPVCVVYCKDNKMKWFKRPDNARGYLLFEKDSPPPSGSVASELYEKDIHYFGSDRRQAVWKSTWFKLNRDEKDTTIYEYCIYVRSYDYAISVIWED